ncbi:MAG: uroporphyrinogen-III C-methyltransferase [Desulfobacterota bacterium]|nr:uroporphyrinogen-III C-methyltransferase [Thermodesulfobacteriota bacterium]
MVRITRLGIRAFNPRTMVSLEPHAVYRYDNPMTSGIVYLVGAGPGDPELLTLRGKRLLEQADVIVYDRLVHTNLLAWARPAAELIFVGKEPAGHTLAQDEINRVIAEKALQGKTVVRLKGGDPFLFGRGGEEAIYLADKGIRFEIVPGVSSALAAPAYAGIPLTHRDMASSVAVVTGHEKHGKVLSALKWDRLAQATDTMVFLMAVDNLEHIVTQLLRHGRPAETPCALVVCGTTAAQRVVGGTLASITDRAHKASVHPPAVFVIGDVVSLRERLVWVEKKPLWGKKVLITRPLPHAFAFADKLSELGAEPVLFPTIELVKEHNAKTLDEALSHIESYNWIVFTSAYAVAVFFEELSARRIDIRGLRQASIAAIGPETKRSVEATGCLVSVIPQTFTAEGLLSALHGKIKKGDRVLLPRSRDARPLLAEGLKQFGAIVDEVFLYRTMMPSRVDSAVLNDIRSGKIDILTFTSPTAVHNFVTLIGQEHVARIALDRCVAVIGPITAAAARSCGLTPSVEAATYTTDGLLAALKAYFKNEQEQPNRK